MHCTLSQDNETSCMGGMAFQGSMRIIGATNGRVEEVTGNGHHGPDYVGAASVRSGKGVIPVPSMVTNTRMVA